MLDEQDKQWISEQITEMGRMFALGLKELADRLERAENTLLADFHSFAHQNELRLRGHEATLAGREATLRSLEGRLDSLADRVAKLEKQRN